MLDANFLLIDEACLDPVIIFFLIESAAAALIGEDQLQPNCRLVSQIRHHVVDGSVGIVERVFGLFMNIFSVTISVTAPVSKPALPVFVVLVVSP